MHKFSIYPSLWELGTYVRGKDIYMKTKQKVKHRIIFFFLWIFVWNIPLAYLYFILSAHQNPHLNTKVFLCKLQEKPEMWAWGNSVPAVPCLLMQHYSLSSFGQTSWISCAFKEGAGYHHSGSHHVVDPSWSCVKQRGQDDFQMCLLTSTIPWFLEFGIMWINNMISYCPCNSLSTELQMFFSRCS